MFLTLKRMSAGYARGRVAANPGRLRQARVQKEEVGSELYLRW